MTTPSTSALEGLRDIHLPDPISIWPLAAGWWLTLLIIVLAALSLHFVMRARRLSPRRAALGELEQLEENYSSTGDTFALASGLSALLRRVTLLRGDRTQVASVHGDERALILGAQKSGFSPALVSGIENVMYQNATIHVPREDALAWLDAARGFIRRAS